MWGKCLLHMRKKFMEPGFYGGSQQFYFLKFIAVSSYLFAYIIAGFYSRIL